MGNLSLNIKKVKFAFIIVVLSAIKINAAIVSDNDGAAFITKAEFDSMRIGFQSQLNTINSSIDNKIEDAISAYISGIKKEKTSKLLVINNEWKDVSAINGVLENTFKVPTFDLMFGIMTIQVSAGWGWNDDYYNNYYKSLDQIVSARYNETWSGAIQNCYRNLVKPTGTSPLNRGDLIWYGRALRYNEKWSIVRVIDALDNSTGWWYQDQPYYYTFRSNLLNLTTLNINGYIQDWDANKVSYWPLSYQWFWKQNSTGTESGLDYNFTNSQLSDVFAASVNLDTFIDADGNAKTKDYEHIISNTSNSEWRVSNNEWPTYISQVSESTIKASNLLSAATTTQTGKGYSFAHHTTPYQYGVITDVNCTLLTSNDATTPNLGMFPDKIRSDAIYQDNIEKNVTSSGITVLKIKPTLEKGLQLLVAPKDAEITWSPEFSYTHVHNGTNTYTDNTHEVDVYFSNGPFSNGVTTSNLIQVSKTDKLEDAEDYVTTTDRKVKAKFKMPENGLVYVKWVPHETNSTYKNMDWIVTLNLKDCSSYLITTSE